jgi:lipopolysaccharide transport system permease protein
VAYQGAVVMLHTKNRDWSLVDRLALPFALAWRHRELIRVIVQREFAQRFRGSALGWIWAIVGPLIFLGGYTLVFSGPIKVSAAAQSGVGNYALFIFAGLIPFHLFTELAARAPNLMRENAWFVKKTIFSSDALGWIALFRALTYATISFGVLLAFQLVLTGGILPTVVAAPLIALPYCLLLLGIVWFLAATGTLNQDVTHIVTTIMPLLIFASPVFYSVSDLPESSRVYAELNPLALYIEMFRDLAVRGLLPDPATYGLAWGVSLLIFWGGHAIFMRYRSILADAV